MVVEACNNLPWSWEEGDIIEMMKIANICIDFLCILGQLLNVEALVPSYYRISSILVKVNGEWGNQSNQCQGDGELYH